MGLERLNTLSCMFKDKIEKAEALEILSDYNVNVLLPRGHFSDPDLYNVLKVKYGKVAISKAAPKDDYIQPLQLINKIINA